MSLAELRSLEDLHRYCRELAARNVEDDPRLRKLQVAKRIAWFVMLAVSFLFYYLLDKLQEALSLLL